MRLRLLRGAAADGRGPGLRRPPHARRAALHPRKGKDRPHGRLPGAVQPGDPRRRLQHPQRGPAETVREQQTARLRVRDPERRPLPRQLLLPARLGQRRLQARPAGDPAPRLARGAADPPRADPETARLRPRHRPDRLRQEHDPGGDARRDQQRTTGPHPHDRGSDRVPARAQKIDRQPARGRRRRSRLRPRPPRRPPRGPRRDPGRRDARPRDDGDSPDRRRDRAPRLRDPAHPVDLADGRPDHRRLPARSSRARSARSSRSRCRGSSPSSCCRPSTAWAGLSPARCWYRLRRSAT